MTVPLRRVPARSDSRRRDSFGAGAPTVLERILAVVALIALGVRYQLPQGLTLGTLVALGLLPMWIGSLRRFTHARLLVWMTPALLGGALLLSALAYPERGVSTDRLVLVSMQVVGMLAGVGLIVWARTVFPDGLVCLIFGIGMLAGVTPDSSLFATNPWKFGYSVPVTVIVLGFTWWRSARRWDLVAVAALTVASAVSDARSSFAQLVICTCLVAWQLLRPATSKRGSTARNVVAAGALAYLVYRLGESLILGGYLGEETQARTAAQVNVSGSLILGGRPELAATAALMREQPWGFGPGTLANHDDLNLVSASMAATGYDPDNGYVRDYLLGNGVELHSVIGDLWAGFGIVGIAFCLIVLVLTVRSLAGGVAHRAYPAIMIFLAVKALWNLVFSPFYSSIPLLMLFLGLMVVRGLPAAKSDGVGPVTPDAHRPGRRASTGTVADAAGVRRTFRGVSLPPPDRSLPRRRTAAPPRYPPG